MIAFIAVAAALATTVPSEATAPPPAKALPACPDVLTSQSYVCKALAAMKGGDPAEAAHMFEQGAALVPAGDPEGARMLAAAGNMWIEANQPGKAAFDLDKALAMPGLEAEQHGEALLDRARAAEAQDDLKTARAKLNEAAESISGDPYYWYFSAALAIREKDAATAQAAIGKALSLAPSDPAILFEAGHVADLAGDDDNARAFWMRAAAGDPDGPIGKAAAKAVEMLGLTPTVRLDSPPPK